MSNYPTFTDEGRAERQAKMAPLIERIPQEWGRWLPAPGWDDLLLVLDSQLAEIDPKYIIFQAKEKFGTLRFYAGTSPDTELEDVAVRRFNDLIHVAEQKSATICELCGEPGKTRHLSWIKTLCDEHDAQHPSTRAEEQ
jgi:hypothetical protein